jgi:hypothetical protein
MKICAEKNKIKIKIKMGALLEKKRKALEF